MYQVMRDTEAAAVFSIVFAVIEGEKKNEINIARGGTKSRQNEEQ